jgi:23S rRNA pseudouridine1911/1915/1917 synthase
MKPTKSPAKGGKTPTHFKVTEPSELMKFLLASLPHKSRDNVKSLLKNEQVRVDEEPQRQFNFPLEPGQTVSVVWEKPQEQVVLRGLSIVFEDDAIIVIDKHAGLLSVATDSDPGGITAYRMLADHVKMEDPDAKVFVVHRLDRDTSGLMMYAKSQDIQEILQEDWKNTVIKRTYAALVEGKPKEIAGRIESYLFEGPKMKVHSTQDPNRGGQWAVTDWELLKTNGQYSLLKVELETGRKNQIRVHLSDLGHPIVGDKKYGASGNPIARMGLHAMVLAFRHPVTGKSMHFETSVPRKFLRLI